MQNDMIRCLPATGDSALHIKLVRVQWELQQTKAELERTRAYLSYMRNSRDRIRDRRLDDLRAKYARRPGRLTLIKDSIAAFCACLWAKARGKLN